jgi:hypothetical protein
MGKHFGAKPFKIKLDATKTLRSIVAVLIESAFSRQRKSLGTMVAGAVMQHLVGAKLEIAIPNVKLDHHRFSMTDDLIGRTADFIIGNTAIDVTTTPTEKMIRKCCYNLDAGLRPLVITTQSGVGGAKAFAEIANVDDRIEFLEIEQFVVTNVYKWSSFQETKRSLIFHQIVDAYNRIIDDCEADPSLRIIVG